MSKMLVCFSLILLIYSCASIPKPIENTNEEVLVDDIVAEPIIEPPKIEEFFTDIFIFDTNKKILVKKNTPPIKYIGNLFACSPKNVFYIDGNTALLATFDSDIIETYAENLPDNIIKIWYDYGISFSNSVPYVLYFLHINDDAGYSISTINPRTKDVKNICSFVLPEGASVINFFIKENIVNCFYFDRDNSSINVYSTKDGSDKVFKPFVIEDQSIYFDPKLIFIDFSERGYGVYYFNKGILEKYNNGKFVKLGKIDNYFSPTINFVQVDFYNLSVYAGNVFSVIK